MFGGRVWILVRECDSCDSIEIIAVKLSRESAMAAIAGQFSGDSLSGDYRIIEWQVID